MKRHTPISRTKRCTLLLRTLVLLLLLLLVTTTVSTDTDVDTDKNTVDDLREEEGKTTPQYRIVGGEDANPTLYPWFTFLRIPRSGGNRVACGGSLIHPEWVLSAAHCFQDLPNNNENLYDDIILNINATKFQDSDTSIQRTAKSLVVHPNFDLLTFRSDIALIQLSEPVTTIQPVTLNRDAAVPPDDATVQILGMGVLAEGLPSFPESLQVVDLAVVNINTCQKQNGGSGSDIRLDATLQLCAAGEQKDSCQGDSGGPMVIASPTSTSLLNFQQVGIVSFGVGCARPDISGVYVRVSAYADYIDEQLCAGSDTGTSCGTNPAAAAGAPLVDESTAAPITTTPLETSMPTLTPSTSILPSMAPSVAPPIPVNNDPNSRSIAISKTGTVLATSNSKGPLRMEQITTTTTTTQQKQNDDNTINNAPLDRSIGLPGGLQSMDDVVITTDGLFAIGLSVYTPAICTFAMISSISLQPIGCITGNWSMVPFTSMSAHNGYIALSGGYGGMTVAKYDTTTGQLDPILSCLNCPLATTTTTTTTNDTTTTMMWPRVTLDSQQRGQGQYGTPLAAVSTVWEQNDTNKEKTQQQKHQQQQAGIMLVDLLTMQEIAQFTFDTFLGQRWAVTVTNYPLVSDFYYVPQTRRHYLYTAHGKVMVNEITQYPSSPTTFVTLPNPNMLSTCLSVDEPNGVLVVGGIMVDAQQQSTTTTKAGTRRSIVAVYDILKQPQLPKLRLSSIVPGQILDVAANGGKVAYVTAEYPSLVVLDLTTAAATTPSLSPSTIATTTNIAAAGTATTNTASPSTAPSLKQQQQQGEIGDSNNGNKQEDQPSSSSCSTNLNSWAPTVLLLWLLLFSSSS